MNIMLYGWGALSTVSTGSSVGLGPTGRHTLYLCKKLVKNRNSSILAKLSPKQARLPVNASWPWFSLDAFQTQPTA